MTLQNLDQYEIINYTACCQNGNTEQWYFALNHEDIKPKIENNIAQSMFHVEICDKLSKKLKEMVKKEVESEEQFISILENQKIESKYFSFKKYPLTVTLEEHLNVFNSKKKNHKNTVS